MSLLLLALPHLKKYGLYVAIALGLLLGWHAVAVHYREQGRAESAARIASDEASMSNAITTINALRTSLSDQNAAIDKLAADGEARAAEAVQQRDAALKANKALTDQAAALRASAGRTYAASDPCASSTALMNAKDL
jgi:small-conductance mechanosensitive channel